MANHLTAYREKELFSIQKRGMQTMNFDKQAIVDVDLNWSLQNKERIERASMLSELTSYGINNNYDNYIGGTPVNSIKFYC